MCTPALSGIGLLSKATGIKPLKLLSPAAAIIGAMGKKKPKPPGTTSSGGMTSAPAQGGY